MFYTFGREGIVCFFYRQRIVWREAKCRSYSEKNTSIRQCQNCVRRLNMQLWFILTLRYVDFAQPSKPLHNRSSDCSIH